MTNGKSFTRSVGEEKSTTFRHCVVIPGLVRGTRMSYRGEGLEKERRSGLTDYVRWVRSLVVCKPPLRGLKMNVYCFYVFTVKRIKRISVPVEVWAVEKSKSRFSFMVCLPSEEFGSIGYPTSLVPLTDRV